MLPIFRPVGLDAATRHFCKIFGRKPAFSFTQIDARRHINMFTDYHWAVEPLKKMGLELKVSPKTEEDHKMNQFLDEPPGHINELVDKIINLDIIELAQFQRRFHVILRPESH